MPIWTFTMKHPTDKPGEIVCRDCKIQAFVYETALKSALLEAHNFAKEHNIPFYRVELKKEA